MTTASAKPSNVPSTDPLALIDVDHVRFYVGNAKQAAYFYAQLIELAEGRGPRHGLGPARALMEHARGELQRARARRFRSGR